MAISLFLTLCHFSHRILIYEAMRDFLPTMEGVIDTPMGPADVTFVDPTRPIKVWGVEDDLWCEEGLPAWGTYQGG